MADACGKCGFGEQPGGVATLFAAVRPLPCSDYVSRVAATVFADCYQGKCSFAPHTARDACDAFAKKQCTHPLPGPQCDSHQAGSGHHLAITSIVMIVVGLMLIDMVPTDYGRLPGRFAQAIIATILVVLGALPLQVSHMCYHDTPITAAAGLSNDVFAPEGSTHWHKQWVTHAAVVAAVLAATARLPSSARKAAAYVSVVFAVTASASYGVELCPDMRPGAGVYAVLVAALASPLAAEATLGRAIDK